MSEAIDGKHRSAAFQVMAKPIGPSCNLNCRYCYYLEKRRSYPAGSSFRMSDRVLEAFVRQYIEAQPSTRIDFLWQGGEPTLMGVDFFRRVVALQRRYCTPGQQINNALQTNGVLLDDRWCDFLRENGFLVGISLDGPPHLHDRYRPDRRGKPTCDRVTKAIERLRKHGVEFNTLTVVSRDSARYAREIYDFLEAQGSRFMQFIPLVERVGPGASLAPPPTGAGEHTVTPWSVGAAQFGAFLATIFDHWVRHDVGRIYVQLFDVQFGQWAGLASALCIYAQSCGEGLALEHNGDLYACDHYTYPDYRLGNILERPLAVLARSLRQLHFGRGKRHPLPRCCRACTYLFACNGGCPKHRFARSADGEPGLNYLCPSYRRFFAHIDPYMRTMVDLLRSGRAPALIMGMGRRRGMDRKHRIGR